MIRPRWYGPGLAEYYSSRFERLAKEIRRKFGDSATIVLATGQCRAGRQTLKAPLMAAFDQTVLKPPEKHGHFDPFCAPVLVSFIQHNEAPGPSSTIVKKGTVLWTKQE